MAATSAVSQTFFSPIAANRNPSFQSILEARIFCFGNVSPVASGDKGRKVQDFRRLVHEKCILRFLKVLHLVILWEPLRQDLQECAHKLCVDVIPATTIFSELCDLFKRLERPAERQGIFSA